MNVHLLFSMHINDHLHARIYENERQPEWQLDFALSFDLTQAVWVWRENKRRCVRKECSGTRTSRSRPPSR